jgi:AAA15 family ATPase/GTPase
MLTTIHIQNFKGFVDTKISPLRKVNLILGGQIVG